MPGEVLLYRVGSIVTVAVPKSDDNTSTCPDKIAFLKGRPDVELVQESLEAVIFQLPVAVLNAYLLHVGWDPIHANDNERRLIRAIDNPDA